MRKPTGHRSHIAGRKRMTRHLQKVSWQERERARLDRWFRRYRESYDE